MTMKSTVEILGFVGEPGWLPWAVQYFFLIGISTTAFVLSLPGQLWRHPQWNDVSRYALLAALVCGFAAPVALLADLHQPGRFLNFYLHPNLGSWMAWGSFFIPLYLIGLSLYAWLCLRPALKEMSARGGKLSGIYQALAYGGHDNRSAIKAAAVVAAAGAALVLLYTGMEVTVLRSRPLWNSPLLPLLLATSAFCGALGMTGLFAVLGGRGRSVASVVNRWQEIGQWASLALLVAWLALAVSGSSPAAAEALATMRGSSGWLATGAWVAISTLLTLWLTRRHRNSVLLPALLALHGTWLVRWIVFIGGQNLPKMGATHANYILTVGPDGLLGIVGTAGLCLVLYIALTTLIPWDDRAQA